LFYDTKRRQTRHVCVRAHVGVINRIRTIECKKDHKTRINKDKKNTHFEVHNFDFVAGHEPVVDAKHRAEIRRRRQRAQNVANRHDLSSQPPLLQNSARLFQHRSDCDLVSCARLRKLERANVLDDKHKRVFFLVDGMYIRVRDCESKHHAQAQHSTAAKSNLRTRGTRRLLSLCHLFALDRR
jgi:hypothetical protein